MQDMLELVTYYPEKHGSADAFYTAAGAPGARPEHHAYGQDDPRYVRPKPCVSVEKSGGGDKRRHLEQSKPERVGCGYAAARYQHVSYEQR